MGGKEWGSTRTLDRWIGTDHSSMISLFRDTVLLKELLEQQEIRTEAQSHELGKQEYNIRNSYDSISM